MRFRVAFLILSNVSSRELVEVQAGFYCDVTLWGPLAVEWYMIRRRYVFRGNVDTQQWLLAVSVSSVNSECTPENSHKHLFLWSRHIKVASPSPQQNSLITRLRDTVVQLSIITTKLNARQAH